jgi:hypothetical protein
LRPLGAVFRQLTIGGLHRDLSDEIIEVELPSGLTRTEKIFSRPQTQGSRLTIWMWPAADLSVR